MDLRVKSMALGLVLAHLPLSDLALLLVFLPLAGLAIDNVLATRPTPAAEGASG